MKAEATAILGAL